MEVLRKLFKGSNIVYYPGCLTKFVAKDLYKNYQEILNGIGVDFIEIEELSCCGSPVLNAGKKAHFKDLAQRNLKTLKDYGAGKIITSCPACYKVLKKDYAKVLGDKWKIEVEHITEALSKDLDEVKRLEENQTEKKSKEKVVTYHDPCHLGRHTGVYDAPRQILEALGYKIKEMKLTKEFSFCCGGGGGMASNYQEKADEVAKERVEQARETNVEMLVTACPLCYLHLRNNADKKIRVEELSNLILHR